MPTYKREPQVVSIYHDGWRLALDTGQRRKAGTQGRFLFFDCRFYWLPTRLLESTKYPDIPMRRFKKSLRRQWKFYEQAKGSRRVRYPQELR